MCTGDQETECVNGAHTHCHVIQGVHSLRKIWCPDDDAEFSEIRGDMEKRAFFQFAECSHDSVLRANTFFDTDANLEVTISFNEGRVRHQTHFDCSRVNNIATDLPHSPQLCNGKTFKATLKCSDGLRCSRGRSEGRVQATPGKPDMIVKGVLQLIVSMVTILRMREYTIP